MFSRTGDILAARCVAFTAIGCVKFIADIHRVHKFGDFLAFGDVFLHLSQYGMADIAILGNELSFG